MTEARRLLHEIAVPRLVGTPSHASVRAVLSRELRVRGFDVSERPVTASPWRLLFVAVAGAALAGGTVPAMVLLVLVGAPDMPQLARAVVLATCVLAALGAGVTFLVARRVTGASLVAVRGILPPRVWLTAHYDAKGQPVSMLWRLVGVAGAALQVGILAALALGAVAGPGVAAHAAFFLPGAVGGALLVTNFVTDRSPGAVDNATGVLAVLETVDLLPADAPVGVILPDAEELGLVGARALARDDAYMFHDTTVINFDGIDDAGPTRALVHRPGPTVSAVTQALGVPERRWLPVLVDGHALARAARECVTLLRGDWRTALVVHTRRDTAARLTLDGVGEVAADVAAALRRAHVLP